MNSWHSEEDLVREGETRDGGQTCHQNYNVIRRRWRLGVGLRSLLSNGDEHRRSLDEDLLGWRGCQKIVSQASAPVVVLRAFRMVPPSGC